MPERWEKIMLNARYSTPQIWVLLISNGYKWLIVSMLCFFLKYIYVKAIIKSVSFLYDFQIKDRGYIRIWIIVYTVVFLKIK